MRTTASPARFLRRSAAMAALVAVAVTSCASDDATSSPDTQTSEPAPTVEAEPPATEPSPTEPRPTEAVTTTAAPTTTAPPATTAAPTCPESSLNEVGQPTGIVADLPDDESGNLEGVTVDRSGNVFVSRIRTGEVLKFAPGSGEFEVFGQIPGWVDDGIGFLGLVADEAGNVWGAAASETSAGIWKFECATGEATLVDGTEEMVFADGVAVDEDGTIWATDADSGAEGDAGLGSIWRIEPDEAAEKWFESEALGAPDANSVLPGANGLAVRDSVVYVVNTAQGKLLAVQVEADGAPGAVTEIAGVAAPDGVALDSDGRAYVTSVVANEIVRVDGTGTIERLASGEAPFDCPSSVHFGAGATEQTLYVVNLVGPGGCATAEADLAAVDVDTAPFVADTADTVSSIAFVVGNAAEPDPLDEFLSGVAGGTGSVVEFVDDDDLATESGLIALSSADLVMFSGSVDVAAVPADVASLGVPMMTLSGPLAADLGLAVTSGVEPSGETWIVMNSDTSDHPLASGLVGQVDVFSEPVADLNFGEVGGDAIIIATTPGSATPTLYGYEAATLLADGSSAPARRVAQFPAFDGLSVVGSNAAVLFFATLDWLLGKT